MGVWDFEYIRLQHGGYLNRDAPDLSELAAERRTDRTISFCSSPACSMEKQGDGKIRPISSSRGRPVASREIRICPRCGTPITLTERFTRERAKRYLDKLGEE